MAESSRRHEEAAARHERAAATHEKAAAFWKQQGDRAREELHADGAAYERVGAALERRWGELITREDAADMAASGGERSDGSATSQRVRQREGRERASARREQAALDREQAVSERDAHYDAVKPGREG